ncbi:hypothetical protein OROMI_009632 [Orobanche minor]
MVKRISDAMYPLAFSSPFKDERQLAAIAFQLLKALYYLRKEKNFVFRHLTPGSILYDQRKHLVKISDILTIKDRFLTPLEDGGTGFLRVREKYMSPEHFSQDVRGEESDHLCKSDIWSLGLCLLELYLGEYPFKTPGSYIFGLYHHIELTYGLNSVDHNVWPPKPPDDAPPLFSDFVSKCLKLRVTERAGIEELGTHELFTNYGFDFSRYKRMLSVISQKPHIYDDNENDNGAKDSRSSDDSNHDPVAACSSDDCKDEDDLVLSGVAQTCDDNVNEDDKVIFEESRTSYASKDETDLMLPEIARDNSASSQDGGDEEPKRKKLRWRNVWQKLGSMSPEIAMEEYVKLLTEHFPEWVQHFYDEDNTSSEFLKDVSQEFFNNNKEENRTWRIFGIGCTFLLLKSVAIQLSLDEQGFVWHVANGGLMQALWHLKSSGELGSTNTRNDATEDDNFLVNKTIDV